MLVTDNPDNRFVEFSRDEIEQSIPARFHKQVLKNPAQIAIRTGHVQLTYNDLNKSANRLAWLLLRESEDNRPVAILMDHDVPAVVAILGALKSDKIFILLDPALPNTRIEQILNDSGANLILTTDKCLHIALSLQEDRRRIINIDVCDASLRIDNPDLKICSDSIAYILYTSGSTGKPKGVMRTHRNDLHNISTRTNCFCISDNDRITLLGSYSTGQGMTDICCALLNGATLFPRNLKAEGFNALADWLIQEKITIYHSAATLFRRFTGELDSDVQFPQMRVIRLGGESVSWRDVEVYKKHFPESCVLANELSCSETNTFSQFLINKQAEFKLIIPVGYPVEDKDVIILDENGNPLDDGDIGEIAIRSRYLSPGYWNRPDLTDLAFTSDPKSTTSRIYRTGDLGRKSADGCLEHLGRKDARIKIRGYRVECHEIELALLQNPTVNQAFVTHGQDAQNESHLIAYLVCIKRPSFNISDLRADLSKRLPSYMVPASFVFLDALPLTPTGKIDRSALPVPDFKRSAFAECYEPPRNAIEKSLAAICSEILNISTIGVCDNLFDLGGHSLSAMQIVARVMKTFRIEVPLKSFYDAPTIAGLSAVITSCRGITAADEDTALAQDLIKLPTVIDSDSRIESLRAHSPISLPALYAVARQRPILPSIAQEPILRLAQLFPGLHQFNVSTAYRLRGPLNLLILKQSLTRLIERHETLHTVFSVENGKRYQSIIESLSNNLDVIDFRELPETERESKANELFREEFQRPFDLAYGPLFRVTVFRLSDDDHILAVTVHQAISDGWSMVIFFRDLAEFYRSALQANQSQLPDLPVQYADFAVWQRDVLQVGLMDRQLAYWKNQLSQPLIPLEFSTRSRQSDEMSFFTARKRFSISGKLYQSVKSLAREEKITPYIVLLTALNILLFRYFEEEDIRVGTLVANRLQTEVENVIGHFVNTVILRTRVLKHLNFKNLAQRIREVVVSAHSNQDIPFEVLLQSLENESTIRCDTLSPVLFIFQGLPPPVILPNLTVSVLEDFQSATAPEIALTTFDLVFSIKEGSEGLTGFVLYKIFVLDEMMITRFMRNFEDLLERLVYDPNESVYTLCSSVEI